MNDRIIRCKAESLYIGDLWVYQRSRNSLGIEIERDDGEQMLSLGIDEAVALRDWLIRWLPVISMPNSAKEGG